MPEWFSILFRYKDKKSPDVLGKFPLYVHTNAYPERRFLWTSRVLVICCVLSLCLTIMLASTIYVLLPQKSSLPSLFEAQDYNKSLQTISKAEITVSPEELLTEDIIRRYITLRHEIPKDYDDFPYRWDENSEFYQLSTPDVYTQFIAKMSYEQMAKLINMDMLRTVNIEWVKRLTNDLWAVQFTTLTTTKNNPTPAKALWRAYLRISYISYDKGTDVMIYSHNPHGLKVLQYSVAYAGDGDTSQTYLQSAKKLFQLQN